MKRKKQKSEFKEGGFSLVETLIAVVIIIMSVVAPLSIASHAITFANVARDEVTATNLAQESIEFIRNERDFSALNIAADATPVLPSSRFKNFLAKFGYDYITPTSSTGCFITTASTTGCALDIRNSTTTSFATDFTDTSFTNGTLQLVNLSSATCAASNTCYISVNSLGTTPTYIYGYVDAANTDWRPTSYTRTIQMECVISGVNICNTQNEVKIKVTVTWRTGPYDKSITMYEFLKSWPEGFL
jgi:Tfp pilus assembly protein PilV